MPSVYANGPTLRVGIESTCVALAGTLTAMFVLIYSLNVIGYSLRDALDPRVG